MNRPREHGETATVPWLLGGFVAALLSTDVLLLVIAGESAEVRSTLALGAGLAVVAGVCLGVSVRPGYAVGSVFAVPVVIVYTLTGLLLPWDQLAFAVGQSALEAVLAVPAVGDTLATALFGGVTLSASSLRLAFRYHYAIVAVGFGGLAIGAVRSRGQLARADEEN